MSGFQGNVTSNEIFDFNLTDSSRNFSPDQKELPPEREDEDGDEEEDEDDQEEDDDGEDEEDEEGL